MNDPHVERLWYRISHSGSVDFDNAQRVDWETDEFRLTIEDGFACFEMRQHFSNEIEARDAVRSYIRAWELNADLTDSSDLFRLKFEKAVVIDRNPEAGVVVVQPAIVATAAMTANVHVSRSRYHEPDVDMFVDDITELMWQRYRRLMDGRTHVTDAAYFCLTALQMSANGDISAAASKFRISTNVLIKMRRLASEKGGTEARKADATAHELTEAERKWLIEAIKKAVRRAAEVATDPREAYRKIDMDDLPNSH